MSDLNLVQTTRAALISKIKASNQPQEILKDPSYKALFDVLKSLPENERAEYGRLLNELKKELNDLILKKTTSNLPVRSTYLDLSAPFDINQSEASIAFSSTSEGSIHPITEELELILDIFERLGFEATESYEIDDDYHMFESLNFPEGHPARDDFDTFTLDQLDAKQKPLVAIAHTSAMQNRILNLKRADLIQHKIPIASVIPGRVFRNEDVDARHEHTFYQLEGVYVSEQVSVANLMSVLREFMENYFEQAIELKVQPFYFPFTEPSFEFATTCPFCQKAGCKICSFSGYIELLGCGMIHPNVLRMAQIDPEKYSGFAFGLGFMRLIMIKYNIEDIRHFFSANLDFLRQFK
jgi:phenylalanyl-tRNA synthetase alpha chain